jgi:hypothetical protein
MAEPYPPSGQQQPYTERPLRVYAEQYLTGAPLPVHVSTTIDVPPVYGDGQPRVLVGPRVYTLQDGDWIISNRYTGQPIEVISDEEFRERFGGGQPADEAAT